MPSVHNLEEAKRDELQRRLRRIEGQTQGIQRMIDEGRDCLEMVESFALYCLQNPEQFEGSDDAVRQAVKALARAGR